MARVNNVDIEKVRSFETQLKEDPSKAKKTQVIEGEWILEEGPVQFRSTISFEGGQAVFETDSPSFMGGSGRLPGPMHYCFYGLASCYTATFVTMASMLGIEIKKLSTRVEADVNFSRVFGMNEDPVMEEVRVILKVVSDAPQDRIREAEELAIKRCPVVFTLKNIVKFSPAIEISTT